MSGRASEKTRTDDRSDRTRISRVVCVPTDAPVDRTYVEACAASDAVKRLAHDRIGEHRATSVVQDHDMDLARAVDFGFAPGPVDEVGVGGQLLAGRRAREDFEEVAHVLELRNHLFDSHHPNNTIWQHTRHAFDTCF